MLNLWEKQLFMYAAIRPAQWQAPMECLNWPTKKWNSAFGMDNYQKQLRSNEVRALVYVNMLRLCSCKEQLSDKQVNETGRKWRRGVFIDPIQSLEEISRSLLPIVGMDTPPF